MTLWIENVFVRRILLSYRCEVMNLLDIEFYEHNYVHVYNIISYTVFYRGDTKIYWVHEKKMY